MHHVSEALHQCVDACASCAHICLDMAMSTCLEAGGEHIEPKHFRLMIACAEICRSASAVMLTGVEQHRSVCAACAEICEACAMSCEQVGGMQECVYACRRCAKSCRDMSCSDAA